MKENILLSGRPYGGVGILWKRSFGSNVDVITVNDDRLVVVKINVGEKVLLIVNVYFPVCSAENEASFIDCLQRLQMLIEQIDYDYICLAGDWNCDASVTRNSPFYLLFLEFVTKNQLFLADVNLLHRLSYTYVSETHVGRTSWLDHVLTCQALKPLVKSPSISYSYGPDHLPLSFYLDLEILDRAIVGQPGTTDTLHDPHCLDWSSASASDLQHYATLTNSDFAKIDLTAVPFSCQNPNCCDETHLKQLHSVYMLFCSILMYASNQCIPAKRKCGRQKPYRIPGWSRELRELYRSSKVAFQTWVTACRPVSGLLYNAMRTARALFKKRLKWCKLNERKLRNDSLATSMLGPVKLFWSRVRRQFGTPRVAVQALDGVVGDKAIAELWKSKYKDLFNSVVSECSDFALLNSPSDLPRVEACEIELHLQRLQLDKAGGPDGISARHLKYAGPQKSNILSAIFSSFLQHGYLPDGLMAVTLAPIPKCKTGVLTSSDNYRPIALATILSKVFERCLITKMKPWLNSTDYQFGFKKNSGVEFAIYVLKFVVQYFLFFSTPVFVCFIDAAKAFDRVNHRKLLQCLLDRGMPPIYVKLLAFWFQSQKFQVKWGTELSSAFLLKNGLRQGGVLSPLLYSVYADELSKRLAVKQVGCFVGRMVYNHLLFADDLAILAPTIYGLNQLLKVCEQYGDEFDVLFNTKKTYCMAFLPRGFRVGRQPVFLSGREIEFVSEFRYLGYILTDSQADDLHLKKSLESLFKRANLLIWKFGDCTEAVKVRLFKCYCNQFFAVALISQCKSVSLNSAKVGFNKVFRRFFRLPAICSVSGEMVSRRCLTFEELIRKARSSLFVRLHKSDNVLVKQAIDPLFSNLRINQTLLE